MLETYLPSKVVREVVYQNNFYHDFFNHQIILIFLFEELCKECFEGNGVEVYFTTNLRVYTCAPQIYGHYEKQSEMVNGRLYFKKGSSFGIWWNGNCSWNIGYDQVKGSNMCIGSFEADYLCPHLITEFNGKLLNETRNWIDAGELLAFKSSRRGKYVFCNDKSK